MIWYWAIGGFIFGVLACLFDQFVRKLYTPIPPVHCPECSSTNVETSRDLGGVYELHCENCEHYWYVH